MTPPPFGFHLFKLDDKDLTRRLTEISISPMERRLATKKILLVYTMLLLVGAAGIGAEPKPVKLVLSPASTVPRADIMKHIVDKCPNVSFVLDSRKSDFMLEAWGWSGSSLYSRRVAKPSMAPPPCSSAMQSKTCANLSIRRALATEGKKLLRRFFGPSAKLLRCARSRASKTWCDA
jgi:hypothetical protein